MGTGITTLEEFPEILNSQKALTRYNSIAEAKPKHEWYRLPKAEIDRAVKGFAQYVCELLQGAPQADKELQHLINTANELAYVARSPAIKVALLGAQGAGKSLMINAIFDSDGLSLTGADGSACTSSITRYVAYPQSHAGENNRFCAEIKFLSPKERDTLLREHARNYYQWHHEDDDDEPEEDGSIVRTKARRHGDLMDDRLKDTAEDVFITLFGSRDDFMQNWSTSAYKSGEFLTLCQMKSQEVLEEQGLDGRGIAIKIANNQVDLLKHLRPFLTKVKGVTCLWPLVDSISIRLCHEIVQAGLEIIDLPGWGDVNLSRVRHAEQIKDTVDVEIILADTVRIASDNLVINAARAAVAHHGAARVKLVATKIDGLNKNQLSHCHGEEHEKIRQLLDGIEDQEADLDDDSDESLKKRALLNKYKVYLERTRKQLKISDRANEITKELAIKLQGPAIEGSPEVIHASAYEYMEWIRKGKIHYLNQPGLPVDMTGVPAIRQFLLSLPAQQNMQDYERHLNIALPAFLEMIRRTVSDTDRDGGFRTIADEFDRLRKGFLTRLLAQAKSSFKVSSDASISKITQDVPTMKEQVEELLSQDWLVHRSGAFNRILRDHGTVIKGTSKAMGLEEGASWNKDLALILAPGFHRWSNSYKAHMGPMMPSLYKALNQLHLKTDTMIGECAANLVTVERARKKWGLLRNNLKAKLVSLMDDIEKTRQKTLEWATMEFDCSTNLISEITNDIFEEVFNAEPALKPANPNRKKQTKQYVEPKFKYKKKKLEQLFLQPDNHFVDCVIDELQQQFDTTINAKLDSHFAGIEQLLEGYSTTIRSQAPIDYTITPAGIKMRAELKLRIPDLEEMIAACQKMIPATVKQEDDMAHVAMDGDDLENSEEDLAAIYAKMAKRKDTEFADQSKKKRIKSEPF